MADGIAEFDFNEILRSGSGASTPVPVAPQQTSSTTETPAMTNTVRSTKRDLQMVHLLKKVSLETAFLCVVLPLFTLFKLIWSPPQCNTELLKYLVVYYLLSITSLIAGYHRFFTHHSYHAHVGLQFLFLLLGGSCGLGSVLEFSSQHMAHHRHVDTERDPHPCSIYGWWFAQWGHKLFYGNRKSQRATADCFETIESTAMATHNKNKNQQGNVVIPPSYPLLKWQHENYSEVLVLMLILIPFCISRLCRVPYFSGIFYCGLVRMSVIQQQWLLIGSLCHLKNFPFVSQPFDDKRSAINLPLGIFGNILTFGEANHNYHHEFPGDYRNGAEWYHFDPAKWFIRTCYLLGLARNLHTTTSEQIEKCLVQQQQKLLDRERSNLKWGIPIDRLPYMSPENFAKLAQSEYQTNKRALVAIEGIVHDVTPFIHDHPGGVALVETSVGKDATAAFNGAVYSHSRAARNLLATMRIAVLRRGPMEVQQTVWEKHLLESNNFKSDSKGTEVVRNRQQVTFTRKNHYAAGAA